MNSDGAALGSAEPAAMATPQLRTVWALHLGLLAGLLLLLGTVFWPTVVAAVRVWWVSPTYSHCFIIIPVSAWLIWLRRGVLAQLRPQSLPAALLLAAPVLAALLIGALASVNEIEQLALVALAEIIALSILGLSVYRAILFPALFLFFLVPVGGYLVTPLQTFTTHFVSSGLGLFGILHYTEGNVIQVQNGYFEVAEACAGLRFLIATIAVGVIFCYFSYRRWYKIALFMVACVVVPVVGNGLRALGIVWLGYISNNTIAHGADHLIYGWVFSVAILFVLMGVGMRYADAMESGSGPVSSATPSGWPEPRLKQSVGRPHEIWITGLAALLVVLLLPAFLYWHDYRALVPSEKAFAAPISIADWHSSMPSSHWHPLYAHPDAKWRFAVRQSSGGAPVTVDLDYYSGGSHRRLVTSTNKMWDENVWHPVFERETYERVSGHTIPMTELELATESRARLVWYTYWSGNRFTISPFQVKLDRLRTAFVRGAGSSLVAISTPIDSDVAHAAERLRAALDSLYGPVSRRLRSAGRPSAAG